MKTIRYFLISSILLCLSYSAFSQLKVLQNGRVCIGQSSVVSTSCILNVKALNNTAVYANSDYTGINYPESVKSTVNHKNGFTFGGYLNNERTFSVSAEGIIYVKGTYTTSDETLKKNVENLENSLEKILQLRGIKYEYKEDVDSSSNTDNLRSINPSQKHIGVLAQEIEEVFPELVKTMEDGTKAVAYTELSGVFIEAFKQQQEILNEQNEKIEDLEARLQLLEAQMMPVNAAPKFSNSTTSKSNTSTSTSNLNLHTQNGTRSVQNSHLYQNHPNPFNSQTCIKFFVGEKGNAAMLLIFDLQGSMVKQFTILQKGDGQISISAGELKPGQYIYSLFENGLEVDSKKMVVSSK